VLSLLSSLSSQAVCRILGVFWELIPAATIRTLLTKLINDSARDKRYAALPLLEGSLTD
jgi:hypothetical protein